MSNLLLSFKTSQEYTLLCQIKLTSNLCLLATPKLHSNFNQKLLISPKRKICHTLVTQLCLMSKTSARPTSRIQQTSYGTNRLDPKVMIADLTSKQKALRRIFTVGTLAPSVSPTRTLKPKSLRPNFSTTL